MRKYNWLPIMGHFEENNEINIFKGAVFKGTDEKEYGTTGIFINNEYFSGGLITANIKFNEVTDISHCHIILNYDPLSKAMITAGLGFGSMFTIRGIDETYKNTIIAGLGDRNNLKSGELYQLEVALKGSKVILSVNGVIAVTAILPFSLPQSQVGIFCYDTKDIEIINFDVKQERPKAFVVMEFSSPYNEIYEDVIKTVCDKLKIEAINASEIYGQDIIVNDIAKQITESKLVIAEITPKNPNVYYEVGYAHALKKPTVLIADKSIKLPFDVSPFRILMYEDSIRGKEKLEKGLRRHLESILNEWER